MVEAKRIANTVISGWHGRRKRGIGENFWQFRPYSDGESLSRIDWRRSARDDHTYVREREWEAAHTIWLWCDMLTALANPVLLQEDRDQLSTIVPVLVDRSQSQQTPDRVKMTDDALAALKGQLARFPQIEPRFVDVEGDVNSDVPSTRLFDALSANIADVPPARIGGAIMLTDGEVHDVPAANQALGFDAPIHGLITGKANEFDRRIEVIKGPRFGIVNEEQQVVLRVFDDGPSPGGTADVTVKINGDEIATLQATPGQDTPFSFKVPGGGSNVLEFSVAALPGEVTTANNRAVHVIDGIRQNLRVLLVSGEPHVQARAYLRRPPWAVAQSFHSGAVFKTHNRLCELASKSTQAPFRQHVGSAARRHPRPSGRSRGRHRRPRQSGERH